MSEFFQWLSSNPTATITLTLAFGIFVLIYLIAFFQGREISIWPPRIGPKPVMNTGMAAILKSQSSNLPNEKPETTRTYLFGYFFIEQDGLEKKILKFNSPIQFHLMSGEAAGNTLEEAIDEIILRTINENGITQSELLKAGLSQPIYHRLYQKKDATMQSTPYVFFKIGLQREVSGTSCEWNDKANITASWHDDNQTFTLQLPDEREIGEIFKKDYIYKQLGLTILEGVDILIFRKNTEKKIEFLLIHRNRSDEVKTGLKDTWEYPKGGMRYHETFLEAVYREVREETSITSEEMIFCSSLGWQTVDVSKRKKPYNTLRVHGFTLYFLGNPQKKMNSEEGHDDFKWVSLEQAKQEVWMEEDSYAVEFFRRWENNEEEILRKVGIKKKW